MIQSRLALVILSSLLYAFSLPNEFLPYGNVIIGLAALSPLLYALYTSRNFRETVLLGAIFGFISSVLVYFWLLFFEDFSIWTLSGVAVAHSLYFILLSPIIFEIAKNSTYRPFLIAAVWVGYEYFKSIGYLGFPWGLMVHSAGTAPFIQIADISGQWGISFLIVLVNSMIVETILNHKKVLLSWLFTGIIFTMSMIYGFYIINTDIPWEKSMDILLVQQDADSWITGNEISSIKKGQDLTREGLSKRKIKPDLVIWSENAFRYPYIENESKYKREPAGDPFTAFLKSIDIPVLVGSPYILNRETMDVLNAVILISADGEIIEYYGKTHPVPFAENIPFWKFKAVRSFFKNVIGINNQGWASGDKKTIFQVPLKDGKFVKFGAPICFEDSFPYIARDLIKNDADVLINLSNDSWSKTISGETQHLAAARLRAIENRRTLIRSTNAGVTTVIDPWGKMNFTLPLYKADTVNETVLVYRKENLTFYTVFGDWFPLLLIGLVIIFQINNIYIKKQERFL
jgi:apolipoprotein N-acyltransferase